MPTLQGWDTPEGSAWCTNAAPASFSPGLYWCIITRNVMTRNLLATSVLKGLKEGLYSPTFRTWYYIHIYKAASCKFSSCSIRLSTGQKLQRQRQMGRVWRYCGVNYSTLTLLYRISFIIFYHYWKPLHVL